MKNLLIFALLVCSFKSEQILAHKALKDEVTPPQTKERGLIEPIAFEQVVESYQRTGDDLFLQQAKALLPSQSSLFSIDQLLQAAWLAQAEHRFLDAQALLGKVLNIQAKNSRALLMKSSVHLVLGQLDQARDACRSMGYDAELLTLVTCQAQLARGTKEQESVYIKLNNLLATKLRSSQVTLAWANSVAADIARAIARYEQADAHYQRSLALRSSVQVRSAYADSLLAQDKAEAVVALIDEHAAAPALVVRRIIAERVLGYDTHSKVHDVDNIFQGWLAQNDYRHAREMSMFYLLILPRPALALTLANENLKTQREPEDIVLLEKAKAANI